MESNNGPVQEFILNPEKLDILMHSATVITFLKAKAKSIWTEEPSLAHTEKIIFDQCSAEAKSAVHLARCVVALLRARDALRESRRQSAMSDEEVRWLSDRSEMDWVTQFKKWLQPMLKTNRQKNSKKVPANPEAYTVLKSVKITPTKDAKFKRIQSSKHRNLATYYPDNTARFQQSNRLNIHNIDHSRSQMDQQPYNAPNRTSIYERVPINSNERIVRKKVQISAKGVPWHSHQQSAKEIRKGVLDDFKHEVESPKWAKTTSKIIKPEAYSSAKSTDDVKTSIPHLNIKHLPKFHRQPTKNDNLQNIKPIIIFDKSTKRPAKNQNAFTFATLDSREMRRRLWRRSTRRLSYPSKSKNSSPAEATAPLVDLPDSPMVGESLNQTDLPFVESSQDLMPSSEKECDSPGNERTLCPMQKQTRNRRHIDLKKFLGDMFKPNPYQRKRREKAKQKRRRAMRDGRPTLPKAGASKSALRRGASPNMPWFMEPVMQAVGEAKKLLFGQMGRALGLGKGGGGRKKGIKISGRRKRAIEEFNKDQDRRKTRKNSRKTDEQETFAKHNANAAIFHNVENLDQMRRSQDITERRDPKDTLPAATSSSDLKNIAKLRRIQEFYQMVDHCNKYMKEIGQSNSEFLNSFNVPYVFQLKNSDISPLVHELEECLKDYKFEDFPILSPKLFSLFPERESDDGKWKPKFLSPNLLSFHKDGVFSLPNLLGMVSTNEYETLAWLDLFMDMAGAGKIIDGLITDIEPKFERMKTEVYPMILKLESFNKRWKEVTSALNKNQKNRLTEHDYAVLDASQWGMLRGQFGPMTEHGEVTRVSLSASEIEENLERDIYRIAELPDGPVRDGHQDRPKRDVDELLFHQGRNSALKSPNSTDVSLNNALLSTDGLNDTMAGYGNVTEDNHFLNPLAFGNKLRDGVAFSQVILSPRAFATTLLTPGFMTLNVLSPTAFTPSILSPRAMSGVILSPTAFTANILTPVTLYGDVLSPKFFHTNILSPRALAALVLSPRTMLFEVLSPKLIELKVLNPNTFAISILGPNIIHPRVLSPVNFAVAVLSPSILSPQVMSKGNFTVQVLSPQIMSGELDKWGDELREGFKLPAQNTTMF
ncbi:MLt-TeN (mlt-10) related [Ditylenchus destructor]|nr:MLt-TeN (mlt-10) related [Ditylenchus destructor]